MADLKPVYRAVGKEAAELELDRLEDKWESNAQSCCAHEAKWENLSVYFKYLVRSQAIYTTNAIEAVHRQFRKLTKTKGGFPNENSLAAVCWDIECVKEVDNANPKVEHGTVATHDPF